MSNTITQFISLLPIDKKENNLLKYVFHANKACHVSVIYVGYELLEITTLYVLTNQDSNCCFKHLSTHEYEIMYGRKSCLVLTVIIQYESSNVMGFFSFLSNFADSSLHYGCTRFHLQVFVLLYASLVNYCMLR